MALDERMRPLTKWIRNQRREGKASRLSLRQEKRSQTVPKSHTRKSRLLIHLKMSSVLDVAEQHVLQASTFGICTREHWVALCTHTHTHRVQGGTQHTLCFCLLRKVTVASVWQNAVHRLSSGGVMMFWLVKQDDVILEECVLWECVVSERMGCVCYDLCLTLWQTVHELIRGSR